MTYSVIPTVYNGKQRRGDSVSFYIWHNVLDEFIQGQKLDIA